MSLVCFQRGFIPLPTGFGLTARLESVPPAAHIGGRYVLAGEGHMALSKTHPSPLEDDRVEYRLHLTPDLLPEMEELLLPGPVQQETNIQVRRQTVYLKMVFYHRSLDTSCPTHLAVKRISHFG